jgi:hypothetical protein
MKYESVYGYAASCMYVLCSEDTLMSNITCSHTYLTELTVLTVRNLNHYTHHLQHPGPHAHRMYSSQATH